MVIEKPKTGRLLEIAAVSNPRIKAVRALSQKKFRDQSGTFLVEGLKLVRDAMERGWELESVIYSPKADTEGLATQIAAKARVAGADILEVSEKILTSITRKDNPQAVIAVVKQRWEAAPKRVKDPDSLWIALDRVRDPGNLGTIIRTADSAGVDGIILVGETTDPFSLEATRATMGSIFSVPLVKQSEAEFKSWRQGWNGLVVGTHLDGATDFRTVNYAGSPVLLLMGNEQQGLPDSLAKTCDVLVYIPMAGAADSLNLAIATGVMIFHIGKKLPSVAEGKEMSS